MPAQFAQPDQQSHRQLLEVIVLHAPPADYSGLFLDEGVPILALLHSLLSVAHEQSSMAAYIQTVLNAVRQSSDLIIADHPVSTPLNEPLTSQEDRILYLFANALTKKAIAVELHISINPL